MLVHPCGDQQQADWGAGKLGGISTFEMHQFYVRDQL